jgi:hypothetical protein
VLYLLTDGLDAPGPELAGLGIAVVGLLLTFYLNFNLLDFGVVAATILGFFIWLLVAALEEDVESGPAILLAIVTFVIVSLVTVGSLFGWFWVELGLGVAAALGILLLVMWILSGTSESVPVERIARPAASPPAGPIANTPNPSSQPFPISPVSNTVNVNVQLPPTPPTPPTKHAFHCSRCGNVTYLDDPQGVVKCQNCGAPFGA